jgi:hypothetical protein
MKIAAGALSVAVLVGIAVGAFLVWGPGAAGVAWGEIEDALRSVDTVHMTGAVASSDQNTVTPLALRKDKWLRREPFAVFEEVKPIRPRTAEEASRRYIFAGNAEKVYWYFPGRGNRAVIGNGLQANFLDDVLAPLAPSEAKGARPPFNVTGKAEVDGRRVILLDLRRENQRTELGVDAETKLLLRLREFVVGPDGRETEVTRLRFEYNQTPPAGVFDWQPPAGATIVDKR